MTIGKWIVIAISFIVFAALGIGACFLHVHRRANALLEDVKHLDTQSDLSVAFNHFQQKHRHELAGHECRREVCQYEFVVNNSILAHLHLAPPAQLHAFLTVFRGKLDVAALQYTSSIFRENSPIIFVQEDFCADRTDPFLPCTHFAFDPHGRNVGPSWNGSLEFGQLVTPEQKRAAWAIDLHCLTAYRGCSDITRLLPTIWKATGPGVVSSRMRSTADSNAEAAQPLAE
jgi:hypothetical protein